MYCANCGKKMSDNESKCKNCGYILEVKKENFQSNQESKNKEDCLEITNTNTESISIINQDTCKKFPLLGQTVTIGNDLKERADIDYIFRTKACELAQQLSQEYDKTYKKDETFIENIYSSGIKKMLVFISEIHTYFIELQIYQIDESMIKDRCTPFIENIYNVPFEDISNKVEDIMLSANIEIDNTNFRKNSRGRWIGGGFGVSGALKGAAIAGGFNAVSGALHSVTAGISNSLTKLNLQRDIEKAYKVHKKAVLDAFYTTIMRFSEVYIDFLTHYTKNKLDIKKFSKTELQSFYSTFNSIKKVGINDKTLYPFIKNLEQYPLELNQYKLLIETKGDPLNELYNIGTYLKLDIQGVKHDILQKSVCSRLSKVNSVETFANWMEYYEQQCAYYGYFDKDILERAVLKAKEIIILPDTEESLEECLTEIRTCEKTYDISLDILAKEVSEKYNKCFTENRSVTNLVANYNEKTNKLNFVYADKKVLSSRADATEANRLISELKDTCEKVDMAKEKDVQSVLALALSINNDYGLCESIIEEMQKKLDGIDLAERTVLNEVYNTREEAREERKKVYNGKKYNSVFEAELSRQEMAVIHSHMNSCKNLIDKYNAYMEVSTKNFKTDLAKNELRNIAKRINDEYADCVSPAAPRILLYIAILLLNVGIAIIITLVGISIFSVGNTIFKILAVCLIIWGWTRLGDYLGVVVMEFENKKQARLIKSKLNPSSKKYLIKDEDL